MFVCLREEEMEGEGGERKRDKECYSRHNTMGAYFIPFIPHMYILWPSMERQKLVFHQLPWTHSWRLI